MTALDSSLMVYARIDNPEEALRYQPGRFSSASDSILVINPIKPRAMHHKLLLPRLSMGHLRGTAIPESDVHSLQQLFDSVHAEEVFEIFAAEADAVERDIRVSMREEHGFEWEIHMGFHAASKKGPVHLHVFSADLLGVPFTSAKEYNEFNVHNDYLQLLDDLRGPGKNHYLGRKQYLAMLQAEDSLVSPHDETKSFGTVREMNAHLQRWWTRLCSGHRR